MLAGPGPLPAGRGWSFEPKWDGFRAIIANGDRYCIRSRRGWQMTELGAVDIEFEVVSLDEYSQCGEG
jgi:ATP-dependent DNA ligase